MYPRILHVYGSIWIHSYGLMIVLGLAVFVWCVYTHPWRTQLMNNDMFWDIMLWGIVLGIGGGRVLYLISNYATLETWRDVFYVWDGGLNVMGSIVAIILGLSLLLRWYNVVALRFFDLVCLYAPLLQAIARIGCFFAGCCSGLVAPISAWYAVTYVHEASLAYVLGVPLYPTQLYASACSLLLFMLLRWGVYRRVNIVGLITAWYLVGAGLIRFGVGFWRYRETIGAADFWGISFDQWVAAAIAAGAMLWSVYILATRRNRTNSS